MMKRWFRKSDIPTISRIWERFHKGNFGLPSRRHVIDDVVVEQGNQLIAYGMIKEYHEVVMILDHSYPHRDKVMALKLMMDQAEKSAKLAGIEQLQLFVLDDTFKDILIKHFGFTVCCGTPLVKTIV